MKNFILFILAFLTLQNVNATPIPYKLEPEFYYLYVVKKGTLLANAGKAIYRSEDDGEHWVAVIKNTESSLLKLIKQGDDYLAVNFPGKIFRS